MLDMAGYVFDTPNKYPVNFSFVKILYTARIRVDKAPPHEAPFSIIFQILVFFAFIFPFVT